METRGALADNDSSVSVASIADVIRTAVESRLESFHAEVVDNRAVSPARELD